MEPATPPQIKIALEQLQTTLTAAGYPSLDPLTASWAELEPAIHKVLDGTFQASHPGHRLLSLRLGALFGERLARAGRGFWFVQSEAMAGLALGFPDVVFTVSPFTVVTMALVKNSLAGLETAAAKILEDRNEAKAREASPKALTPADYQRTMDPSFIEFLALDEKRAHAAWELSPRRLIQELKDALFRAQLSKQTAAWLETSVLSELRELDQNQRLIDQAERAPRAIERVGELFAGRYGTGLTTESGWSQVALRLLSVDATQTATIRPQALAAIKKGAGPLVAFLHEMPKLPDAPQEGILGLFQPAQLSAPHPQLAGLQTLRLVRVNPRPLLPLLQKFQEKALREALEAFLPRLQEAVGAPTALSAQERALFDEALGFCKRLQDTLALAVSQKLDLCVRRGTEQEGYTGGSKAELRAAVQG